MNIRSLKQVLHWAFLLVGIISIIILPLSVSTYLDYAREGYGLDVSITDARLTPEGRLALSLRAENPGGLDVYLGGFDGRAQGNLTLGETYPVFLSALVRAGNTTTIIISLDINDADFEKIRAHGMANIVLEMNMIIPERDARTSISIEAMDLEVRT